MLLQKRSALKSVIDLRWTRILVPRGALFHEKNSIFHYESDLLLCSLRRMPKGRLIRLSYIRHTTLP